MKNSSLEQHLQNMDPELKRFLTIVSNNFFRNQLEDPMVEEVDSFDKIFEFWSEYGFLQDNSQEDIKEYIKLSNLSESNSDYIMDLKVIQDLELG